MDLRDQAATAFVYTADRVRAVAFYRDTLGLPLRSSDEFGDTFDLGHGRLRLTAIPDWQAGSHPVLGWAVRDIAASVAALTAQGIAMTIYEGFGQDADGIWSSADGRSRLAWFPDPDGNCLMLSQHMDE